MKALLCGYNLPRQPESDHLDAAFNTSARQCITAPNLPQVSQGLPLSAPTKKKNCTDKGSLLQRYADGETVEGLAHASSVLPVTMSSNSQSPVSSSWDNSSESSTESNFVLDIPTAEPYPGMGSMYYDHAKHGHYPTHHGLVYLGSGRGEDTRPAVLQYATDAPVIPTQFVGGPRGEFDCFSPGCGNNGLAYTDEANTKLSNRIRRQCFNCKAIETSTWRRSVLTTGKLVRS